MELRAVDYQRYRTDLGGFVTNDDVQLLRNWELLALADPQFDVVVSDPLPTPPPLLVSLLATVRAKIECDTARLVFRVPNRCGLTKEQRRDYPIEWRHQAIGGFKKMVSLFPDFDIMLQVAQMLGLSVRQRAGEKNAPLWTHQKD